MKKHSLKSRLAMSLCALLIATSVPVNIFATDGSSASDAAVNAASTTGSAETAPVTAQPQDAAQATAPTSNGAATAVTPAAAAPSASLRAAVPNYNGTVEFIGQWTNESSKKENSTKNFTSADDKLGDPLSNPGLFRGAAKVFLGWSDKEPVNNGEIASGGRFFSKDDTIAKAFPEGIPADAKLYGVYFSLNEPDKPFPTDQIGMGLAIMNGMNKIKINDNKSTINADMTGEEILPDTTTVEFERDKDGNIKVIDVYEKKDDVEYINEVVLNAQFKMNDTVAMLVYKNPWVGYGGNVLTSKYNENKATAGNFDTRDGDAGYTYVDMEVNLDPQLTVPEKLYLEFKGYSWRPLYVFGANKELLNILDPTNDTNLGNNKDSFNTLINNTDPKVTFGVETKGNRKLIIRTIIRHDDANGIKEKIAEESIVTDANGTIAEKIIENMTLRSLSSNELKKIAPKKSNADINASVIRIADAVAKSLAESDGADTLVVSGEVRGMAVADAGKIGSGWLSFSSRYANKITAAVSNTIAIGYTFEKYNVTYTFTSGTDGKDLPAEVASQQPQDEFGVVDETEIKLPAFADVKVDGGTWTFKTWYKDDNGTLVSLSENPKVSKDDLNLVGEWVYVADEKPPVKPSEDPSDNNKDNPAKDVKKDAKAPKTGDERNLAAGSSVLLLSGLAIAALRKRKIEK